MLFEKDIVKGASRDVVITGGLPGNGKTFDSYWIKVDQGTISFGKGRAVGQNEQMRWNDPNPVNLVSYVGFGGGKLNRVHYKNIEIQTHDSHATSISAQNSHIEAVLPADFNAEQIKAQSIAAGLHDGQLELFAVINHELYYRERGSMATKPWKKVHSKEFTKVRNVSVAPNDGTVYVVTMDGRVLRYNWPMTSLAPVITPVVAKVKKVVKKVRAKKQAAGRKKGAIKKNNKKTSKKNLHKKTTKRKKVVSKKKKSAKSASAGAKKKVAKKKLARKLAKKRVKKATATPQ